MADPAAHEPEALGASPPAGALEAGRRLFAQDCRFVAAAGDPDSLPDPDLPEIAFAGRSNVGKSSLLNALTGRAGLARVSNTPGRTQQINFFALGGRLMLVDLPGYGFAKAPPALVAAWSRLVESYLLGRAGLRRALLLVDARLGLKQSDREAMAMLDRAAVPYQLVLTKTDRAAAALGAVRGAVDDEAARHPAAHPAIMEVSARSGLGLPELRAALAALAQPVSEKRQ